MTYAVIEVHRHAVIGAGGARRETRDQTAEAVRSMDEWRRSSGRAIVGITFKSIPVGKTWAPGYRCGNIRRAQESGQCTETSVKTGLGIHAPLDGQFQSARTEVTNLDAGTSSDLMLNTQTPGQNLRFDDREDGGTSRRPAIQLSCAGHIDLQQSATSQESLARIVAVPIG